MSARFTAAEAAEILRDLARGREDGSGVDVWPLYERAEDAMAEVVALAVDRDAQRARADAAEAECARLRADRDRVDLAAHSLTLACDAARADAAALRAIVEGRAEEPPTDAEMRDHMDSGGAWLVTEPAVRGLRPTPVTHYVESYARARVLWWTSGAVWIAVRDGRPCAWPTVTP